jgi:hypothetical protein
MEQESDNLKKQREIAFCTLHPDADQAASAVALLSQTEGILLARRLDEVTLEVHYHLLAITLAEIEVLLEGRGYHLDNRLVHKIRRALFHYTEETQRANLGCAKGDSNCTQKIFATTYRKRAHGCQDDRPDHWRRYL